MSRLGVAAIAASCFAGVAVGLPSAQPGVPAPESVLGFAPCADYQLATYEQIADYFRALDRASDRMQLVEIGRTAEGRPEIMAIVSSESNLRGLDRFRSIAARLARARDLTDDAARALADAGRAVVWIDFGLHSTEVAHAQTAPLFAHKVVTEESSEMRFIRDNVILLLVPSMNPDGTTMVADWYMKHRGTPYEKTPPELYHRYAGHDNNRDWFMFNMPESQNAARQLYAEWFPEIVYDHHQAPPFPARIFVPPFEDPMNPHIPPLVMRGVNLIGDAITRRLDQEGKRGAISRLDFDTWWNGGMRTAPYFHNMLGILTETAHSSATPATYDPKTFPKRFSDGTPTLEPTTYYPSPYLGGEWHLRDSCAYMTTASMAVLDIGAKRRVEWLYDIYRMGRDAIRAGAGEAYLVPADQWDPGTAVRMIHALATGGVEIHRLAAPFAAGGRQYGAGSFVIRGSQPFLAYVRDLLQPQHYPDRRVYPGGPPEKPYDITGWTLPYQMGVEVVKLTEPIDAPLEPLLAAEAPQGLISGRASFAYAIDPRANDSFTAVNRLLRAGEQVARLTDALVLPTGTRWPAGAFLVAAGASTHARMEQVVNTLGLHVAALDRAPAGDPLKLRPPRVALYHGYAGETGRPGGNTDEGWTRWILEQFEFPYTRLLDVEVRAGGLGAKYEAIVLPDATYQAMLAGVAPNTMPPEYTGGMTPRGVANLYEFVSQGGTLIAIDGASELPITAFGLPIRNLAGSQRDSDFYAPGTLLSVTVDPDHPIGYGMPPVAAAFFINSPVFAIGSGESGESQPDGVTVVGAYSKQDLLMSGWMLGEHVLKGRPAVVDVTVGKGRVVLLGFRAQHRGQPHGTFKLLFNAILLGSSDRAPATKMRETVNVARSRVVTEVEDKNGPLRDD